MERIPTSTNTGVPKMIQFFWPSCILLWSYAMHEKLKKTETSTAMDSWWKNKLSFMTHHME